MLQVLIKAIKIAAENDDMSPEAQMWFGLLADHTQSCLIALIKLCADPKTYMEVICCASDEIMLMANEGTYYQQMNALEMALFIQQSLSCSSRIGDKLNCN